MIIQIYGAFQFLLTEVYLLEHHVLLDPLFNNHGKYQNNIMHFLSMKTASAREKHVKMYCFSSLYFRLCAIQRS